ncbi:amidohydrolase [[Clostridium] cellulosi]|uniref:Amidohydrolase n=1 Tax=[Clostridium] cellulosi TaxID=29343 RepID=A0A078KQL2_9FIRM|nr:amidohydrolase [[Clostridium] cellulosi]
MLIKNAKIYTMEGRPIENGWLRTENGIIHSLGEGEAPDYSGEIIDAGDGVLLPGLIDAHTHIGMCEDSLDFEGEDTNEDTDPSTPQLSAEDAINPMDRCFDDALSAGVTTVITGPGSANPIGGRLIAMKTYGKRVDKMVFKNPVAVKFALGENPKTCYHANHETPVTRMATASIIREQLYKAQKYMDKLEKASQDEDEEEPDFEYKCEVLIPLLKREIQAHFHAHRADDIFTAIRIAKQFNLDYVIVHGTDGHIIADELKEDGARVLSGPFLCDRCKPELHNQTPKGPGIMSKAGLEVAIITDHPVIPIEYLSLCAALAVKNGMDYEEALRAITINPARITKIDNRVGSLKAGKDADLVIFDGDPLQLYTNVKFVAVGGKRVK